MTGSTTAPGSDPALDTGRGLPRRYYYSHKIWAREMSTLWADTWQLVGRESELAHPGDYLTYMAGDQPLIVIRGDDGRLRAMHNICPHRGAPILYDRGSCAVITCYYHGWRFERDGRLKDLPQQECLTDADRARLSLTPARVGTWGGFVFANAAAEGEPLASYLAEVPAFLEQYEHAWHALAQVDRWTHAEPVNWKFVVERYRGGHHLSMVHSRSRDGLVPGEVEYAPAGRHYQMFVPYVADGAAGGLGPPGYQGHLFPNVMFNAAADAVSMFRLTPQAPEMVSLEVTIYQTRDQKERHPYDPAFRRDLDGRLTAQLRALRTVQEGAHAPAYGVELAALHDDDGVSHFHRTLASYYPALRQDLAGDGPDGADDW